MRITHPNALGSLTVYRNIYRLPVCQPLDKLLHALAEERNDWADHYCDAFFALSQAGYDSLASYLTDHLLYDESPYALAVATGKSTAPLRAAAAHDLQLLSEQLVQLPWAELSQSVSPALPLWQEGTLPTLEELEQFYTQNGYGKFARYHAFLWQDGELIPVQTPDFVPPEEMLGYQRQRDQVVANTRALLAGHPVNNMLLYGSSGTGKSATVKALLGMEGMDNLRLIEVDKTDLGGMPDLVRTLGHQPQKFILFIDDLAFDKDDRSYSLLKTILEGSVEPRPTNVAVYATSNRRHLVRETFSDRQGDEVDARETISEKTSLSERFGLRISFQELTKPQFMNLIRQLAAIKGVSMPEEELMALAVRWDIRYPNRTPRGAVQFINSLATL